MHRLYTLTDVVTNRTIFSKRDGDHGDLEKTHTHTIYILLDRGRTSPESRIRMEADLGEPVLGLLLLLRR